ncbi:MAG: preprotein translocase subunit SecG [Pirellulales bacterium]
MLVGALGQYFFGITIFLTSVFLVLLVLVQRGRGGGLTGALGGPGGQSAFGTKAGDLFTRITIVVAAIWIFLCAASVKVLNPAVAPNFGLSDNVEVESASMNPSTNPDDTKPSDTKPADAAPAATTPAATTPAATTPAPATPAPTTPTPEATLPATTPAADAPKADATPATEPAKAEPAKTEPVPTEPAKPDADPPK